MKEDQWFSDIPVIGKLPSEAAAKLLQEIGEDDTAGVERTPDQPARILLGFGGPKPWQHTAHTFGFVAPSNPGAGETPILMAGEIKPDLTLQNARIKITLDRLRIAAYPGSGIHHVLFDFYAQNQLKNGVESLHFTSTFRAQEGEQAGVVGYPLFVGLKVGTEGVAFRCFTVNVKNDDDEAFLAFLESDTFRGGLKLVNTAQPALAPFSEMAFALTRSIAKRNRNVPVQDFYLGLDFSNIATRAKLAEGSYIAVQIPESSSSSWKWSDWIFHPSSGHVLKRSSGIELIPYNYAVFSVSRI